MKERGRKAMKIPSWAGSGVRSWWACGKASEWTEHRDRRGRTERLREEELGPGSQAGNLTNPFWAAGRASRTRYGSWRRGRRAILSLSSAAAPP